MLFSGSLPFFLVMVLVPVLVLVLTFLVVLIVGALPALIVVPGPGLTCCPVVLSGAGSHPMSSCSQWWFWVFMWWLCQSLSWFWGCDVVTTQTKPIINEK